MKEFLKWLETNENIGKVIVWLLIITIVLIILNTTLRSLGLPHYQILPNNLRKLDSTALIDFITSALVAALNFISIMLLVFRLKEIKQILVITIPYLFLNYIIYSTCSYIIFQVFIIVYSCLSCYFYANRNVKYIFYCILAFIISTTIQGIWYTIKVSLIDYATLNYLTKSILSLDYFIIMGIIILVKEIHLKKRGERNGMLVMDRRIQK